MRSFSIHKPRARQHPYDQAFQESLRDAGNIAANRNVNFPVLTDSDTLVFENHTQILTNKTLTSPTLNTPVVGASVDDSNNNSLISFVTTNSAVNHVSVKNNITNSDPLIQAAGTDTNINLNVDRIKTEKKAPQFI